jgi:hypothetical protein
VVGRLHGGNDQIFAGVIARVAFVKMDPSMRVLRISWIWHVHVIIIK